MINLRYTSLWMILFISLVVIGNNGCEETTPLGRPVITSPKNETITKNCIRIFWTTITDAESYRVEIAHTPDFATTVFQEEMVATTNNLLYAATIQQDSLLFIRVHAISATEKSEWSETVRTTINFDVLSNCNLPIPTTPALVQPPNNRFTGNTAVDFEWEEIAGAAKYELELYLALSETTRGEGVSISPGNFPDHRRTQTTNTYRFSGFKVGESYLWRVRAIGNGCTTEWSRQWYFTVA